MKLLFSLIILTFIFLFLDTVEGKGEIEIPRRSIRRSKERRKKEVWQHPQLDSNSSISQGDHAMSNDNHNNASSNDYLGLNTSERTSYKISKM